MRQDTAERRAETFELFFDLMFVFAITQVTKLIEAAHDLSDWVTALAVLAFLWWMYGGFVWLASNTANLPRLALTMALGMLAFLMFATGLPALAEGRSLQVGLAALAVVLIHAGGFRLIGDGVTWGMVFSFSWLNLAAAGLLVLSGFLPPAPAAWVLALIPVSFLVSAVALPMRAFTFIPGHFVERHGLLLIIVFGESVIAAGIAIGAAPKLVHLAEAMLALMLTMALWLSWFARDDRRSEAVLTRTPPEARGHIALVGYWLGFLAMILGVLLLAAGLTLHFEGHGSAAPWIAGCCAAYFAGMALFRWQLGLAGWISRLAGSALALAALPLAARGGGDHGHDAVAETALLPLCLALALALAMLVADRLEFGQDGD